MIDVLARRARFALATAVACVMASKLTFRMIFSCVIGGFRLLFVIQYWEVRKHCRLAAVQCVVW